jgi:2-isopropylmalate synthase
VHQDGVLKHRSTYELLDPRVIGHPVGTEIVLGKLSGRSGFAQRVAALGLELSGAALDRAFARFQTMAEGKGEVDDSDVLAICGANSLSGDARVVPPAPGFSLDL